ncbi:MAG: Adenosylcobinamide-phosphate guanylyltransferase, partial [uncultured Rubrobacteraceae bacterium]
GLRAGQRAGPVRRDGHLGGRPGPPAAGEDPQGPPAPRVGHGGGRGSLASPSGGAVLGGRAARLPDALGLRPAPLDARGRDAAGVRGFFGRDLDAPDAVRAGERRGRARGGAGGRGDPGLQGRAGAHQPAGRGGGPGGPPVRSRDRGEDQV